MKKKIIAAILGATLIIGVAGATGGCGNKDMWDTVYTYDHAIISLQNGEIVEGRVESWSDYEDGDQLQITIDGKTYLEHSSNVDLIANYYK